jgi:hypothetical protein
MFILTKLYPAAHSYLNTIFLQSETNLKIFHDGLTDKHRALIHMNTEDPIKNEQQSKQAND